MSEVLLSELTVGLIVGPNNGTKSQPPASISQHGPMSIAEARSRSTFNVSLPNELPPGFTPVDAMLLSGDVEMTLLTFGGAGGKLTLVQAPTSQYKPGQDGTRRYFVVGQTLSPSKVGDAPAALAEIPPLQMGQPGSYNLVWVRNGVLNQLLGHGLALSDIASTAASIP